MSKDIAEGPTESAAFDMAGWFFENGLDVFLVLRERVVERVNPAWTTLTGWTAEETVGKNINVFSHSDNPLTLTTAAKQIETYGFAETDVRVRTKAGRWLWVSGRIRLNKDLVMAALRDVTAERRRQAEDEQARHTAELLREVAGVIVWRFDPERNVYLIDEHLTERSVDGGAGHRVLKTDEMATEVHPEDANALWAALSGVMQDGEPRLIEYRHHLTEKGWTHYKVSMRGSRQSENGKWEVMGLTQDITELANALDIAIQGEKAAKEAAESKSQFLANMSHEIRTPLNGVLGVLHLLKTEGLSTEGRGLLAEAVNCGSMLAELLNDVLDFSKIEAGHLELQAEPADIGEVINGVTNILRPQIEAKGLNLDTEIEPCVGWVRTDPVRLRQILFNLIGNAVKFTSDGGVTVGLKTLGRGDERRLRLEIRDTGIGISAETQGALFTRFHQADATTTRRFGGTGLGLAITRTLVELMGGEVGVHSVEGQGSIFWVDLPGAQIAAPAPIEGEAGDWLEGLKILVVEDNATNRLIATKMLENLGAAVETAENGALGVAAVKCMAFDLVFMDVQMPVMDGVTAAKAIRGLEAPAGRVPIIAMTANVMAHQLGEYHRAGMNGAVSKPLSPAAIIAQIAKLVDDNGASAAA